MGHPALDLTSKTAVVIGGTSGSGMALGEGFAQAGANVVPSGRRAELVASAADRIRKLGRRSLAVSCDVTDRKSIETLLQATCAEFGRVEILVNCAGTTQRSATVDVSEDNWNSILDTNLSGTFRACQVFGRKMIEQKDGRIINITSLSSWVAFYQVAAYSARKASELSLPN